MRWASLFFSPHRFTHLWWAPFYMHLYTISFPRCVHRRKVQRRDWCDAHDSMSEIHCRCKVTGWWYSKRKRCGVQRIIFYAGMSPRDVSLNTPKGLLCISILRSARCMYTWYIVHNARYTVGAKVLHLWCTCNWRSSQMSCLHRRCISKGCKDTVIEDSATDTPAVPSGVKELLGWKDKWWGGVKASFVHLCVSHLVCKVAFGKRQWISEMHPIPPHHLGCTCGAHSPVLYTAGDRRCIRCISLTWYTEGVKVQRWK